MTVDTNARQKGSGRVGLSEGQRTSETGPKEGLGDRDSTILL